MCAASPPSVWSVAAGGHGTPERDVSAWIFSLGRIYLQGTVAVCATAFRVQHTCIHPAFTFTYPASCILQASRRRTMAQGGY